MTTEHYTRCATEARQKVLSLIYKAGTAHAGSCLSAIDILSVLFDRIDLDKDKFILSAGWKAAALYYFLWRKERITLEELDSFCQPGSKWIGLAEPVHKDIPFAGGSMGMGLAAGVSLAWSKKQRGDDGHVYVLESDGGMQVGITWEAAWFADQHQLSNLTLLIDKNDYQAMGKTEEILHMRTLREKLLSFGFNVMTIDGHDFNQIENALTFKCLRPKAIVCQTLKGKGWKRAENNNLYHYKQVEYDEYVEALKELNGQENLYKMVCP